MNVHPALTRHPKFVAFKRALGDAQALEYLLNIWGHCQEKKRGEDWGKVSLDYVEAIAGWSGEAGKLWTALTMPFCGKNGWIHNKNGKVIVTAWNEHNGMLLKCWRVGSYGGRPKDSIREPSANHKDSIREPKANHKRTLLDVTGLDVTGGTEGGGARAQEPQRECGEVNCPPRWEEVREHGQKLTPACPEEVCQEFFDYWNARGWQSTPHIKMADFRPALAARWRVVQRKMVEKTSSPGAMMDAKTRRANLAEMIAGHPANPQSAAYREDCTTADRKNLTALRAEVETLTRRLAGKKAAE